jgi:uncharacterized protein YodC (DUF2158 family)
MHFKTGDHVRLNSGEPDMTVIGPGGFEEKIEDGKTVTYFRLVCLWHGEGGTLEAAEFLQASLTKV